MLYFFVSCARHASCVLTWAICGKCTTFEPSKTRVSTQKTTAIRRVAVRDTSVSRHHEDPIKGHTKALNTSQDYHIKGFKEGSHLVPRDSKKRQSPGLHI